MSCHCHRLPPSQLRSLLAFSTHTEVLKTRNVRTPVPSNTPSTAAPPASEAIYRLALSLPDPSSSPAMLPSTASPNKWALPQPADAQASATITTIERGNARAIPEPPYITPLPSECESPRLIPRPPVTDGGAQQTAKAVPGGRRGRRRAGLRHAKSSWGKVSLAMGRPTGQARQASETRKDIRRTES